jgi:Na+/glutamate symporter
MKTRMLGQPCLDFGVLVGGIVVGNQVNRHVLGGLSVDLPQETQPFLMTMFFSEVGDQFAFQIIQSGKQGQRTVANVIMGRGLDVTDSQGQAGLGAFQRAPADGRVPIPCQSASACSIPVLHQDPARSVSRS